MNRVMFSRWGDSCLPGVCGAVTHSRTRAGSALGRLHVGPRAVHSNYRAVNRQPWEPKRHEAGGAGKNGDGLRARSAKKTAQMGPREA